MTQAERMEKCKHEVENERKERNVWQDKNTLEKYLRKLCPRNPNSWAEKLPSLAKMNGRRADSDKKTTMILKRQNDLRGWHDLFQICSSAGIRMDFKDGKIVLQ